MNPILKVVVLLGLGILMIMWILKWISTLSGRGYKMLKILFFIFLISSAIAYYYFPKITINYALGIADKISAFIESYIYRNS